MTGVFQLASGFIGLEREIDHLFGVLLKTGGAVGGATVLLLVIGALVGRR